MDKPRFRRFIGTGIEHGRDADGPFVRLRSPSRGLPFRLEPWEFDIARTFDGEQDPAQRINNATARLGREVDHAEIESLANELAVAGLLESGSEEPLPVPPQTQREDEHNAWSEDAVEDPDVPPTTMPGNLSGAARPGAIGGNRGARRGAATPVAKPLPPDIPCAFGSLLSWPLWVPLLPLLMTLLAAGSFFGLWSLRVDAARDVAQLLEPGRLLLNALSAAVLVNVFTQCARASAIRRATGENPVFGLQLLAGFIPALHTDTEGPAERAERDDRLRIIAAAPMALLWLLLASALGWFALHDAGNALPSIFLGWWLVATLVLLLRCNPVARLDGYYWLAQKLGIPDLRDQALIRIFGFRRAWSEQQTTSNLPLQIYGVLVVLWLALAAGLILFFPGQWIAGGFGGAALGIFLIVYAIVLWSGINRVRSRRGDIGGGLRAVRRAKQGLSARQWLLIAVLVLIALIPYRFEPSGRALVLPAERAQVHATQPGSVREVLVSEGDEVAEGELLLRLEDSQQRAQLARAEAEVARLEAELGAAEGGARDEEIALAEQRVATAEARSEFAAAEAERAKQAFRRGAIPPKENESAIANARVRAQELAETQANLSLTRSGSRAERVQAIRAELKGARAQRDFHEQQLENMTLRAPIAGTVLSSELLFAIGDYIERGDRVVTIQSRAQPQAEILIPESAIGEIATGATVRLRVWAYPDDAIMGSVARIAPAAEESRYGRVVRVMADLRDNRDRLLPEMTGQAKIEGDHYPLIVVFTRAILRFLTVQVWAWLP